MTETTGKTENNKDATNGDKKPDTKDTAAAQESSDNGQQPVPVKEMKAINLQGFGGLKSVKVLKKPEPSVGEGEVLIRVKAGGLSFSDLMLRQGVIDNPPKTPVIMGSECAGQVEAIGDGVDGIKVGDRVAALTESKAWAEFVTVPAKYVYKLPDSISYSDAVAITMNYVVAYCLLFDVGNLRDGQTVVVHSLGGGIGQAISQLCKTVANVTLIGTASKHKHEQLKDCAAHIFDHSTDYVQEIKKLYPDGVDLVLDCLCGEDANKGFTLLKPLGRYVLYGTANIVAGETKSFFSFAKSWWQVDKVNPMKLYDENKSQSGFNLRKLLFHQDCHEYVRNVVNKVYKMFSEKKITPVIDSTFAFEDVAEAMQKLHDRKNIGKIILDPEMEPKPRPVEEENPKEKKRKSSAKSDKSKEDKKEEKDKNEAKAAEETVDKDAEKAAGDAAK